MPPQVSRDELLLQTADDDGETFAAWRLRALEARGVGDATRLYPYSDEAAAEDGELANDLNRYLLARLAAAGGDDGGGDDGDDDDGGGCDDDGGGGDDVGG